MKIPRRRFLQLAGAAAAGPIIPHVASALDYPTRPVRIIVGFPAGGVELAKLLAPFRIRPQTVRILSEASGKPTLKGYYQAQFEAAWRAYCKAGVTPSQPRNIKHLRRA